MRRVFILSQLLIAVCVLVIAAGPQDPYVVLIDAGHGGKDLGTISNRCMTEKDITLDLAQRIGSNLENVNQIEVRYTRDSDTFLGLKERIALAGEDVDLIISLHTDQAERNDARGMKLYIPNSGSYMRESARIGEIFAAGLRDLDIPYVGVDVANFYVLHHAPCPVLLISAGYLSNDKDLGLLASHTYRDELAGSLASALKAGVKK